MFDNIGRKLKVIAKVLFWLILILFFALPFALASVLSFLAPFALLIIVVGVAIAYGVSAPLYGFGELIEKTSEIANNTRIGWKPTPPTQPWIKSLGNEESSSKRDNDLPVI